MPEEQAVHLTRTGGRSLRRVLRNTGLDRILTIANVLVIVVLLFVLLRPGGRVYGMVAKWRDESKRNALVTRMWPALLDGAPRLGQGARVVFVEFSDYQCPFCQQQHRELNNFLQSNPMASVALRHLPLLIHPSAEGAARSVICAEQQGKFLQLHNWFFETDRWKDDTNWVREAVAVGVTDLERFSTCLHSATTTVKLERDHALAEELDITGTPTVVYQSGMRSGVLSDSVLRLLSEQ